MTEDTGEAHVGEVWEHRSGLRLRVIGRHVPGDRDDELRVWCEVIGTKTELRYKVGDRDGWTLLKGYGWCRIGP